MSAFQGARPSGFEPAGAPPSARLEMPNGGTLKLTAETQYRGSGHVVNIYRLSSDTSLEVEPRDFYRDGVVAVSLEGDTVSERDQPRMIVVEVDRG
nr:type-F conjugative transfer system secretin TraK [Halomonas lionensis]